MIEEAGKPADEVAAQFDLEIADVYAALQYYHTHTAEMERAERKQRDRETAAQRAGATSLSELREEPGDE